MELPKQKAAVDMVEIKVAVQSMAGGVAKKLELYLDNRKVKEWTQPPYVAVVPVAKIQKATLMRATATDEDGKEFTDLKLLKGESRFMSKVEVDLVELPVSVYDSEGRLVKSLAREDFTVTEDGARQELTSFEFAESLPLSLGIVIDGSGSMKDAMPIVHQAASEFVQKLVSKEKDQGFVIEFRERPALLAVAHPPRDGPRARDRRDARERRDRALRLRRDGALPVPRDAGPQGGRRPDGRRRQPFLERLRDAAALRAFGGRPDLLHRPEPLVPRHGHQGAHERARRGHGRRGVLRRRRRPPCPRSTGRSRRSCARSTS